MELINIQPCCHATLSVCNDTVLDTLHHNKHCDGTKLRTQVADTVNGEMVINVNVRLMIKDVQRTIDKKL